MAQRLIDIGATFAPAYIPLVTDSTGQFAFDPNSLPQTITYNSASQVETITVHDGVDSFTQTYAYIGGNVTSISAWVKV